MDNARLIGQGRPETGGLEASVSHVHSGNYQVQGPDTSVKLKGVGTKEVCWDVPSKIKDGLLPLVQCPVKEPGLARSLGTLEAT